MLEQHSLFQKKPRIASREDLIGYQLNLHGDKIIVDIALDQIVSLPQVRRHFDDDNIRRLAEDMEMKGLIQPITVMRHPSNEQQYILLVGGNRYLAAQYLNWNSISCMVKPYCEDVTQNELIQLAENMHRTDLNPIDLAEAVMRIKQRTGFTLAKLARSLGRTVDSVKQYSRINKLTDAEKDFHVQQKSTKNEILDYLAVQKKSLQDSSKDKPMALFDIPDENPCEGLSIEHLQEEIKKAELFLKQARKQLKLLTP